VDVGKLASRRRKPLVITRRPRLESETIGTDKEKRMRARSGNLRRLVGCIGLAILASGVWAQAPQALAVKTAALVNGEAILLSELEPTVAMILKEKFKVQPPTEAQKREVRLEVLQLFVNDILMHQFLRKNAPKVEAADVERQMAEFVTSLQKQKPPRTLAEFCRDSGQTETQVRTNVAYMLQWMAYAKTHLSDDELKRYYIESKEFFDQVTVRASHIVIRVAPTASEGERKAVHDKLAALREEIVGGKQDFGEAAKKLSQCPSAPNGGDIGYFSRKGMLDESFAKVAYSLKVGDVSDIVTTDYGMHLIKVTDRKAGQPSDFEKIKDEVRDFCTEEMRQKILTQERKAAKIDITLQ
jgi:hypothetical protein